MDLSKEVQAAFAGALLAGVFTMLGSWWTVRQEERRRGDEERRRNEEWRREKCNEAYSSAIYYLFKLQLSSRDNAADKDVRQHLSESQRYLALLEAYHPEPDIRQALQSAGKRLKEGSFDPSNLAGLAGKALEQVEYALQQTWAPGVRAS
jgi:hypothetical protein